MDWLRLLINLVIALPLMFFLYRDSRARDYSWMLWTMMPVVVLISNSWQLALLFAVTIIVFYLMFRPKGAILKCPKCGKPIHHELTVCPFCRRDAKKECLHCHEPVPWEADQCPFCKSRNITKGSN